MAQSSTNPSEAVVETRPGRADDVARDFCVLVFDAENVLAVTRDDVGRLQPSIVGRADDSARLDDEAQSAARAFAGGDARAVRITEISGADGATPCEIFFCRADRESATLPADVATMMSLAEISELAAREPTKVSPLLLAVMSAIKPHIIRIPYLNTGENDYVYRFRTDDQRNHAVYSSDERSRALYNSALCEAIKLALRQRERTATGPARLDFGAVRYVLPSHFGFCLGVQNAIERAYETIAENPGRPVYMISELIHNPFVNDDLRERGLVYLQSDRGVHFQHPTTGRAYWDELRRGDSVLTPAFGATDEDKVRLVEKGIAVNRYDATCMLVEKVWKAARRFALSGHTGIIHGKNEQEETKATFSNCAKFGPSIIIRDRHEAEMLAAVILADTRAEKERLFAALAGRHTPGFDVERDLNRLAVVNQTTLLRNETVGIIDYLESIMVKKFGAAEAGTHIHNKSRGDTLCYATQVNQDALERAIAAGADAAIVVGGRNSSNTFQLFRICEARFRERAFYIQSERNILSRDRILHYIFPYRADTPGGGTTIERDFLPAAHDGDAPLTVLITGGASCPDGIIQQVITRINGFFPAEKLRPIETVLSEIASAAG
jgi:4-hydroxy-3-methylbut-2-enyl diphosphate reductase